VPGMQQYCQCSRCGSQNYIGEKYCWNCQQKLQYSCPRCNAPVSPTMINCSHCLTLLPWPTRQYNPPLINRTGGYHQDGNNMGRKPWIIGIIMAILFMIVGGAIVFAFNKTSQENQNADKPTTQTNTSAVAPPSIPAVELAEIAPAANQGAPTTTPPASTTYTTPVTPAYIPPIPATVTLDPTPTYTPPATPTYTPPIPTAPLPAPTPTYTRSSDHTPFPFTPSAPPPISEQKLIGLDTISSVDDHAAGNYFHLTRYTANQSGVIDILRVFCIASGNIKVAIYTDNGGEPGSLLNAINTGTTVYSGWNSIPIPSTAVTAGANYWLAMCTDSIIMGAQSTTNSIRRFKPLSYATFTFPVQAGTGFTVDSSYYDLISGWGQSITTTPSSTPTPTPIPTIQNGSPGISSITFTKSGGTPVTVMQNTTLPNLGTRIWTASEISCLASDPDNDTLTYSWSTDGGKIQGTGSKIGWIAPGSAGAYSITVNVTDGKSVPASFSIPVSVYCCSDGPSTPTPTPTPSPTPTPPPSPSPTTPTAPSVASVEWDKVFGSAAYGSYVLQANDNNFVIVGLSMDKPSSSWRIWLIKTNNQGNIIWDKMFGSACVNEADCVGDVFTVKQVSGGGFVILGRVGDRTWVILTDANGNKTSDMLLNYRAVYANTAANGYIIITHDHLIKVDMTGTTLWDKNIGQYSAANAGVGSFVEQTVDNGFIMAGVESGGPYGGWLKKTDALGNEQWSNYYLENQCSGFNIARQTSDGGYIAAGSTGPRLTGFLPLIKVDSSGTKQWERQIGPYWHTNLGNDVRQTSDGGYILTGMIYQDELLILKMDSNGSEQWRLKLGVGNNRESGRSVQQTSDSGFIVLGSKALPQTDPYGIPSGMWLIKVRP